MTIKLFIIYIICSFAGVVYSQTDSLRNELNRIINFRQAKVGIGILNLENGDTLTINGKDLYPMQSVFKFPLALTVMHLVDQRKLSLDQSIKIDSSDYYPDTYSPIADKYPEGTSLTLKDILYYTVSLSDNNGCDILFRIIGGPLKADEYIRSLGIQNISIKATEEEMHNDWNVQFTNNATPYAAVRLLSVFYKDHILTDSSFSFLWKLMTESPLGLTRIKGELPEGTDVAHKTGSSGKNDNGVTAADNDIGIVTLPDGKYFAIAVFVSGSKEDDETNDKIISDAAKLVYEYFTSKKGIH